jgi:hypothetical protein
MAIDVGTFQSYTGAPELPASLATTDSVDEYIISLIRHAATVDFSENPDTNLSNRPYRWGISEDSNFDGSIEIPVSIGNLTVTS